MLPVFNDIKVKDWMTKPVISVSPETPLSTAQHHMRTANIRHLPVTENGRLVGILSLGDLREASPSDATALSVWELNYLWDKLTVEKVMTRQVYTVSVDDLIIDALKVMINHKFNALPVLDEHHNLIGILTEIDIFEMVIGVNDLILTA